MSLLLIPTINFSHKMLLSKPTVHQSTTNLLCYAFIYAYITDLCFFANSRIIRPGLCNYVFIVYLFELQLHTRMCVYVRVLVFVQVCLIGLMISYCFVFFFFFVLFI